MKTLLGVTALGLALASAGQALAQEPERTGGRESPARVNGVIREIGTETPLAGAAVRLVPAGGATAEPRLTDNVGRFNFPGLPPGRYLLEVERLGYGSVRDSLVLEAGSQHLVSVDLVPEALELDPIVVTTSRRGPDMGGFDERRRTGLGTFMSREDIERRSPSMISDLFRTVAGVQVVPLRGRSGADLRMRGGCRPDIVIDGMVVRPFGGLVLDDYLSAHDVEAVEVYMGSQAPAQFTHGTCGAVVFWTRRGEPTMGGGSFWKRLAFATVFLVGTFLLVR